MKIFDDSFFNKEMATIIPQHGEEKKIVSGEKMFDSPNLTFQSKIDNIPYFLENKSFVFTNCFSHTTLSVEKAGVVYILAEKEPPLSECNFDHVRLHLNKMGVKLVAEFNGELLPGYNTDLYLWAGYFTGTEEWKDAFLNNSFKIIIANVDESYIPISSEDKLEELINLSTTAFKPLVAEELKKEFDFYRHENRGFQAVPAIVKTNGGNYLYGAFCTPFGKASGNGENHNCYVVIGRTKDFINYEDTIMVIDPDKDGPARTFEPILWNDPDSNRIYFAYCQAAGKDYGFNGRMGTFLTYTDNPDDEAPVWAEPKRIFHGLLDNPPIKCSDGNWYMAINFTRHIRKACFKGENRLFGVYILKSEDSYNYTEICHVSNADSNIAEPCLVEYEKGKILLIERTEQGMYCMRSTLKNINFWTEPKPMRFNENGRMMSNVASRKTAIKISENELLVVYNDTTLRKRENLTVALSTDGGKTFKHKLLLDERILTSYPQIIKDNGGFTVIYDQGRIRTKKEDGSELLVAHFYKEDILAGEFVTANSFKKRLVSRYGNAPREDSFAEQINAAKRIMKEKPEYTNELARAIELLQERDLNSYKMLCAKCNEILNEK